MVLILLNHYLALQNDAATPVDSMTVTSKYSGIGGNSFTVTIANTPGVTGSKRFTLRDPDGIIVGTWDGTDVDDSS